MNTQIEFDEDNKAFGFDEWEYLNFRSRPQIDEFICNEINILLKYTKELDAQIKLLEKKEKKLQKSEWEFSKKTETLNKKIKDLENIERLCFQNSNVGFLDPNSLAVRIKNSLLGIKKELHARIFEWRDLCEDMIPMLDAKKKLTKRLKRHFFELSEKYPDSRLKIPPAHLVKFFASKQP